MGGCGRLGVQWQVRVLSICGWRWLGTRGAFMIALTLALTGDVAGVGRCLLQGTPECPCLHPGLRHLLF